MPPKRAARSGAGDAGSGGAVAAVGGAANGGGAAGAAQPLSARSADAWIAAWFVLFFLSTSFTDLHNFTASVMGVEVAELKGLAAEGRLLWPPRALTALYFQWAETVDPLLYQNPVWWCVRVVSAHAWRPRGRPTLPSPPRTPATAAAAAAAAACARPALLPLACPALPSPRAGSASSG